MTTGTEQPTDAVLKRALLETSYGEILDATKHQDDKIGRIITGLAFLTAAALAFANQIGVDTRFDLVDRRLPLLAYAVGAFVVGVVFTVSMLLSSLTTGLTLPGSARPSGPTGTVSLIYFYSVARATREEWRARWDRPGAELRADLDGAYVDETYNLAVRTNHKYTRTNEAVALLSFTFFALGAAFVLGVVAASTARAAEAPVSFGVEARVALATYAGAYVWLQILVARREHRLRLRTRGGGETEADTRRIAEFRTYQFAAPALVAAPIAAGRGALGRAAAIAVVLAAVVAIGVALSRRRPRAGVPWRLAVLAAAAAMLCAALAQRDETWRLLAAAGVPALLAARNFIENWRRGRQS